MFPKSEKEAKDKFSKIKKIASTLRNVDTVICPPFLYLSELRKLATGGRYVVGAQNAWIETDGAYTGEVSPAQLLSLHIQYVIIGHSERRARGESDELVNKKIIAALRSELTVVLCVGESKRDDHGQYLHFISDQLKSALKGVQRKDLKKLVIAYEPIWAIGNNALRAASTDDALEVTILIKRTLADLYGKDSGVVQVLYGGSVDAKNSAEFFMKSHIDGLLVGRASLDPKIFGEILKIADETKPY